MYFARNNKSLIELYNDDILIFSETLKGLINLK